MDKKEKTSKKPEAKSFDPEILLISVLRDRGLIFPDSDKEVEKFESNPANKAELPPNLKDPNRIINAAQNASKNEAKIKQVESQSTKFVEEYKQASGFYRSGETPTDQDEKEINSALTEIAKKLKDKKSE